MKLPAWSLLSELSISEIHKENNTYNDISGSFFSYSVNDHCPVNKINYLTRLQIFNSLTDKKGIQRRELNDYCFVYALQQTGKYSESELNQIRLRIQSRYLSQKAIN